MPDSKQPKRILVVDDERSIAFTLQKIFLLEGYDAIAVQSAEDALALLPDWIPDFAFLDVKLPGMNGIDLAIRMKAEYPQCRVTLKSGHNDTVELLSNARAEGHVLEILPKPIDPTVLLALVADPGDSPS